MSTNKITPREYEFMAAVNAAVVLDRYEEALLLFLAGIEHLTVSAANVDKEVFRYHISSPLMALLRFKLGEHPEGPEATRKDEHEEPSCSFCGKNQQQVEQLIGGPGVFICNECVTLCSTILSQRG